MLNTLRNLIRELFQWACRPPQPGLLYVFQEELHMPNRFRVHVLLPPIPVAEAGEVVSRKLTRTINETGPSIQDTIPIGQSEFTFEAQQDDRVHLKLVHFDDAGNASTPSHFEFTVTDTVPPSEPGAMAVSLEEIPDPVDPPPAPDPVPEPTPEPTPEPPAPTEDLPL